MTVKYYDNGKRAGFNGAMFCRDDKTGYYLNSNTSTRLHRAVWEYHNGAIPNGYEIHHIDHDKSNNEPENLALLSKEQHHQINADGMTEELREKLRKNLTETARPKAAEWHKSEVGRAWHRKQWESKREQLYRDVECTCQNCGKKYVAVYHGNNKFCSDRCRAAARRGSGVDDEVRECIVCGKPFTTSKYSGARTGTSRCRGLLRWGKVGQKDRESACV